MELTPFSLMLIAKGLQQKRELEFKERDQSNYFLAMYILLGISGKMPNEPFSSSLSGAKQQDTIDVKKNQYEKNKRNFLNNMIVINSKYNRKED